MKLFLFLVISLLAVFPPALDAQSVAARWPREQSAAPAHVSQLPFSMRVTLSSVLVLNTTKITLASTTANFVSPTAADYFAGYEDLLSAFSYTVQGTAGATNVNRTITISLATTTATLGGNKPSSDLQFKLSTQPATSFQSLTCCTTPGTTLETYTMRYTKTNDPHTSVIDLRMLLKGSTDAPSTYTTGATGLSVTFNQVAP